MHEKESKRLDGAESKSLDQLLEEVLVEWIYNRRVSRKLVMKIILFIYHEKANKSKCKNSLRFVASAWCLKKFMLGNGLSFRRTTSVAKTFFKID